VIRNLDIEFDTAIFPKHPDAALFDGLLDHRYLICNRSFELRIDLIGSEKDSEIQRVRALIQLVKGVKDHGGNVNVGVLQRQRHPRNGGCDCLNEVFETLGEGDALARSVLSPLHKLYSYKPLASVFAVAPFKPSSSKET
jgi:hypothetical protein